MLNYIYNDCKQLLSFPWSKKINTEDNNGLASKQDALHKLEYLIFPEFSGESLTSRDRKSGAITQTIHTRMSWVCSLTQARQHLPVKGCQTGS